MKKYRVARDCIFKGGYWNAGTIVTLGDDDKPPYHFEEIKGEEPVPAPIAPKEPATFSEINKVNEANVPTTGMASKETSANKPAVEKPPAEKPSAEKPKASKPTPVTPHKSGKKSK